jgi:hypothetical protein
VKRGRSSNTRRGLQRSVPSYSVALEESAQEYGRVSPACVHRLRTGSCSGNNWHVFTQVSPPDTALSNLQVPCTAGTVPISLRNSLDGTLLSLLWERSPYTDAVSTTHRRPKDPHLYYTHEPTYTHLRKTQNTAFDDSIRDCARYHIGHSTRRDIGLLGHPFEAKG